MNSPDSFEMAAWGIGVFAVSLPVMWFLGQIGVFAMGFGIWIIPWFLGAMLGGALMPQGSSAMAVTEFDGPIYAFAFFASIQNALMAIWWLSSRRRRRPNKRFQRAARVG